MWTSVDTLLHVSGTDEINVIVGYCGAGAVIGVIIVGFKECNVWTVGPCTSVFMVNVNAFKRECTSSCPQ
jgi:hypothetical protein